jgi:threonine/homoserine/homoserine lactone efflux protein
MLVYLMLGITYAFAAAVQPGPFQTYIIAQTLKKGWRPTWPAAFAPVISDGPILLLVLFILKTMPDGFINVLRIFGSLFLFYLSGKAYITWKHFGLDDGDAESSEGKTLFQAVVINLLNPAPYMGWSLIMGPLLLEGWRIAPVNGISLIVGFYLTMVATVIGIIFLFAYARRFGPRLCRVLIGASSVALFGFGLYQFIEGVRRY